jgi:hypothetical protein
VPHDANPQPVPHDAKPEPMPHDANPQPVPHDAKPEPVPHYAKPEPMPHDAKPEPVPHDAKPEPVPHDAKPEPMPHDAKPEPMPHDAKPQPVPHDADPQPVPAKAPQPSGAFTWRPKTEEEIEAQQRALEAAPEEPPARLDPPAWARPAAPPPLSDLTTAPPPDLPSQAQSLEALLSEDPLSVAASRAYVHPPKAPETATPAEPLPTWKLVAAGAGAFVLVGLTMYAILRSFGG